MIACVTTGCQRPVAYKWPGLYCRTCHGVVYRKTPKGRAARRRYRKTDQHKDYQRSYQQTEKCRSQVRAYRKTDRYKLSNRNSELKKRFGITVMEYDAMLESQGGVCSICGGTNKSGRRLGVDHNHKTGRVRALLCGPCNCAIGNVREDPAIARKLAVYIGMHLRAAQQP